MIDRFLIGFTQILYMCSMGFKYIIYVFICFKEIIQIVDVFYINFKQMFNTSYIYCIQTLYQFHIDFNRVYINLKEISNSVWRNSIQILNKCYIGVKQIWCKFYIGFKQVLCRFYIKLNELSKDFVETLPRFYIISVQNFDNIYIDFKEMFE